MKVGPLLNVKPKVVTDHPACAFVDLSRFWDRSFALTCDLGPHPHDAVGAYMAGGFVETPGATRRVPEKLVSARVWASKQATCN